MEFYTMHELLTMGKIPWKYAKNLKTNCEYCSTPKKFVPILTSETLRQRKCSNPNCLGHTQHRADSMFKHLGVKGIGPETCLSMLRALDVKTVFDLIPKVFGDKKPIVNLYEIAQMAAIPGYQGKWEEILRSYASFEEYFSQAYPTQDVLRYKDYLIDAQKYFLINPPMSATQINVMITGGVSGYARREDFIKECNKYAGHIIYVKLVGKRKTGVQYLITEGASEGKEKLKAAVESHGRIQIVTPSQFLQILTEKVNRMGKTYINEERK